MRTLLAVHLTEQVVVKNTLSCSSERSSGGYGGLEAGRAFGDVARSVHGRWEDESPGTRSTGGSRDF